MSYLKENIMRVDNSFSQKNYKFDKMVDFIRVLIVSGNNTNYYYINKNKNNEYIIGRKNTKYQNYNQNPLKITNQNKQDNQEYNKIESPKSPSQLSYIDILKNNNMN